MRDVFTFWGGMDVLSFVVSLGSLSLSPYCVKGGGMGGREVYGVQDRDEGDDTYKARRSSTK